MAEACSSCDIAAGQRETPGGIIHGSELFTLTHHGNPHHAMAGFLILQPRRHVEHIADLSGEEAAQVGILLKLSSTALMQVCRPEKVYVCSFGSVIKHVHFYLIPQRAGMPTGNALLKELAAGKYACTDKEAAEVAERIRVIMRN